jgi:invasion protein IalB
MTRKMEARVACGARVAAETRRPQRKRWYRATGALAAIAFAASFAAPAHALTVQEQGWQVANSKCKSGDAKQCELRDQLSAVLKRHGCVYHDDGEWWKCSGAR